METVMPSGNGGLQKGGRAMQSMTAEQILEGLNPEQRRAVETTEGPVLILAGAGSGKTNVLTRRVAYLLATRRAAPWNILAITFTNKAAREMRDRIEQWVGPFAHDIWAMTFHALCVRILRRDIARLGYTSGFTVLDDADQLAVVRRILQDLNIDSKRYDPRAVLGSISQAKNILRSAAKVMDLAGDPFQKVVGTVYLEYEKRLKQNNALDFDDLIMKTVQLFREAPDVLEHYHRRFRYLHVDEYQDTNHAQYVLVSMLAQGSRNLCVVGDSDQSIYRWRGADIQNILQFERDYPDATLIRLEQNYRSTQTILDIANEVIRHNTLRQDKRLWSALGAGEKARLYEAPDDRTEAAYIARTISDYVERGGRYSDCAVLYRTNAQSRVIEEALLQFQIPYRIFGGLRFYERKEIKDVLSYLRVILNPADDVSLERILNVPRRGIGDTSVERLQAWAQQHGTSLYEAILHAEEAGVTGRGRKALAEFAEVLHQLIQMQTFLPITDLTEEVLARTGYREALEAERSIEAEARLENLNEFLSLTAEFDARWTPQEDVSRLEAFLTEVALVSDADLNNGMPSASHDADQVSLMTLHSAKGLEFPVVFLAGLDEGIFPHARALYDDEELEEERRLCYVGITRAMRRLYLTRSQLRMVFGEHRTYTPSRFLQEMPAHLIEPEMPPGYGSHHGAQRTGCGYSAMQSGGSGSPNTITPGAHPASRPALGLVVPHNFGADLTVSYAPGDKVEHRKWGIGVVRSAHGSGEDLELVIQFAPPVGERRLAARFAPIRKVSADAGR